MIRSRRSLLPLQDCCRLLGVSRASVYRSPKARASSDAELERLAGEHPRFGYRRLAVLMGWSPKKTRLAMSRQGLMARQRRRRVQTTFPVPVDAANLCQPPSSIGELLVSDFTYVPLVKGFAYFAITLDVLSRRVRGWSVSRSMSSELTLEALALALGSGPLACGWVHHSDRGSQYASAAFRELVATKEGTSSFSRPASPAENAFAESFFARFKDEVVRVQEPQEYSSTFESIRAYVSYYNEHRPHSSLGNLSPLTFEKQLAETASPMSVS